MTQACDTCLVHYMSIMVSEGVTRKLSDTRLMLIPTPVSSITREDDIHYTSPWLSHSPRALSLSPHSHHHTELLPLSPFGMDPNSPFSHFAPNSNHCHPGAQAIITKLGITASSVLASQPEQPVVVRWEVWSGVRGRKAGLSLTNQVGIFIDSKRHLQKGGEEFGHHLPWREAWNA